MIHIIKQKIYNIKNLNKITDMQTFIQKFREQEFIKLYNRLSDLGPLLNQLIYGKNMLSINRYTDRQQNVSIYLHERNPSMLMAILRDGRVVPFDLKGLKINQVKLHDKVTIRKSYVDKLLKIQDFGGQILILLFKDKDQKFQFSKCLTQISQQMKKIPSQVDSQIFKNFVMIDKDKSHSIQIRQFLMLLQQLKLSSQSQEANRICKFIGFDKNYKKSINIKQFEKLSKLLMCRQQFKKEFESYTNFKLIQQSLYFQKVMSKQNFSQFLSMTQSQNQKQIQQIVETLFKIQSEKLSFVDFCIFMGSHFNKITSKEFYNKEIAKDHPLNHYYCYSSHNTYLTGDQLLGESNATRYRQDLQLGIRCVQIDCMDGKQGPVVTHAFTATSIITLDSVLAQIKRFQQKMKYQHTPIILSIQNHCNIQNQNKMAELMKKYFGSTLFTIGQYQQKIRLQKQKKLLKQLILPTRRQIKQDKYPTLQQLMGKIIIKCTGNFETYTKLMQYKKLVQQLLSQKNKQQNSYYNKIIDQAQKSPAELIVKILQFSQKSARSKELLQVKEYLQSHYNVSENMIQITAMLGKGKIGSHNVWESVSIKQQNIKQAYKFKPKREQLLKHTEKSWIRSYPDGIRAQSSNYNPYPALQMGVQLIALNTQIADQYSHILFHFFQRSSKNIAGYRLKQTYNQYTQQRKSYSLCPISASKINYDDILRRKQIPSFQVYMRLFCHLSDMQQNKRITSWKPYTQQITQNGFNPIFQKNQTIQIQCKFQQLAFIGVNIENVGFGVIPLQNLQKGYRFVTLYDRHLNAKESKIFFLVN